MWGPSELSRMQVAYDQVHLLLGIGDPKSQEHVARTVLRCSREAESAEDLTTAVLAELGRGVSLWRSAQTRRAIEAPIDCPPPALSVASVALVQIGA